MDRMDVEWAKARKAGRKIKGPKDLRVAEDYEAKEAALDARLEAEAQAKAAAASAEAPAAGPAEPVIRFRAPEPERPRVQRRGSRPRG